MNPRVTLRTALEDPELLGDVLGGETLARLALSIVSGHG